MTAADRATERDAHECEYRRALLCVVLASLFLLAVLDLPSVGGALTPFAVLTARWTVVCLGWLGTTVTQSATELRHAEGFACELDPACTALVPFVLLAAAIATSALSGRRKTVGLLGGAALMLLLNQARLTSLVWCGVHAPQWLDLLHDWCWPALLASCGVLYWRRLRRGRSRERGM